MHVREHALIKNETKKKTEWNKIILEKMLAVEKQRQKTQTERALERELK